MSAEASAAPIGGPPPEPGCARPWPSTWSGSGRPSCKPARTGWGSPSPARSTSPTPTPSPPPCGLPQGRHARGLAGPGGGGAPGWAACRALIVATRRFRERRGRDPRRAGIGLWLAGQLCHQLEMSRAEERFTVRLTTTIPRPPSATWSVRRGRGFYGALQGACRQGARLRRGDAAPYQTLEARASVLERRWDLPQTPTPPPRRDDPVGRPDAVPPDLNNGGSPTDQP
jgi:hypothetical protein